MKPTILLTAILGFTLLACNKHETEAAKPSANSSVNANSGGPNGLSAMERKFPDNYPFSSFICLDSANKMLSSYLASINDEDDSTLHCFIYNADSLRAYLANPNIKNVKFMFGHTLEYINEGHFGQPAGYSSGNLTIIVAGYDVNGTYIYHNGGKVLEHGRPCPNYCDVNGAAANSTLSY